MSNQTKLSVADRIEQLMTHLGIEKAHFAGRSGADWSDFALNFPHRIASLSLIGVSGFQQQALDVIASRLLVVGDDGGGYTEAIEQVKSSTPAASYATITDYKMLGWTDVVAERTGEIEQALVQFLKQHPIADIKPVDQVDARAGEVAGISYRMQGSGPPLILLPLTFAPSQWEPLIPALAAHFRTIILAGAHLGMIAALEERGKTIGYRRIVKNMLAEMQLQPGQSVLDVGPGSGVLDRWLMNQTGRKNHITGVDMNPYMVREAAALARSAGLQDEINFVTGDATALKFPDNSFDVCMSFTVLEEGDTDKMLAEMVRVTKPGGKVGVIVRAMDLPFIVNLDLPSNLLKKVNEMPCGAVAENGCADASLYLRFHQAGLKQVTQIPQLATFGQEDSEYLSWMSKFFLSALDDDEIDEVRQGMTQAGTEGTFFISWPHHCAVGTVA